jgi:hypothetical protein
MREFQMSLSATAGYQGWALAPQFHLDVTPVIRRAMQRV